MMQDKTRTSGIKKLVNYSNQVKACKVQPFIVHDPNPKILSEVNQKSGPKRHTMKFQIPPIRHEPRFGFVQIWITYPIHCPFILNLFFASVANFEANRCIKVYVLKFLSCPCKEKNYTRYDNYFKNVNYYCIL